MIDAKDVTVRLGSRVVLRNLSHRFRAGGLTVIVGPNGAGKSTLIKALSGELRPLQGSVVFGERPLQEFPAHELAARRAVVPQATALAFPFTVQEVVGLGATVPGFGLAEQSQHVLRAMRLAEVGEFARRYYTELSGGERQRVHFARALCQLLASQAAAHDTALLLDEPTSNLDLPHQAHIMAQARIQAELGRCVVAVLHDLNLAAAWADEIVALHDGRIYAAGSAREVLNADVLQGIYGSRINVLELPGSDLPLILPYAAPDRGSRAARPS